ncbi:MAG: metal-dependent hydrolase [Sphingobacteriales bacterium]|nr:metal-dependent hydrolase [Sphingobacteriales bacterium]
MDSLSQIVLGAACGEAVLGKKIGNRAMLWGAIGGTIPDLDVVFLPFFDYIQRLSTHRGYSHALLICVLLAFPLAYLVWRKRRYRHTTTLNDWRKLFALSLVTHPLLDWFTTYGTSLFLPFSRHRAAVSSIFVVDPLYTLPFLICVLIAAFLPKISPHRRFWNYLGIGISCAYLLFTVFNKWSVERYFKASLVAQNIQYQRIFSAPMPFANTMWYNVAQTADNNFYFGYCSIFDNREQLIPLKKIERDEHLWGGLADTHAAQELRWFSRDFYTLSRKNDTLHFHDLCFGTLTAWHFDEDTKYFLDVELREQPDGTLQVYEHQPDFGRGDFKKFMLEYWQRMKGI